MRISGFPGVLGASKYDAAVRAPERVVMRYRLDIALLRYNGQGVLQDYVRAHMWFNLAAAGSPSGEARRWGSY